MNRGSEQDRKDYVSLIKRVQKIDKDAAQYLAMGARVLFGFAFDKDIAATFTWNY